jgi:hypothetical protein
VPDADLARVGERLAVTIYDRFVEYHGKNPEVYELFRRFAHQLWSRGFRKYSADAIIHQIRWTVALDRGPDEQFKISNNYVTWYARMLIHNEPQFKNFFSIRELRAEY